MALLALHGSVVAVTGGARGIGLATARALVDRGARVALGDLDLDVAEAAAAQLGPHALALPLDVRQRASFEAFLAATEERFGPLDALVNNAGIMPSGDFLAEPDGMSDAQIDVNLRGVILGCKVALPRLLAHGRGHIVNVASMAGRLPVPGLAVYCATKFAVVGLTETLAEEYRDSGVDFTAVLPAKVTTELAAGTERAGRGIPTVSAEDVAAAIVGGLGCARRRRRHDRPERGPRSDGPRCGPRQRAAPPRGGERSPGRLRHLVSRRRAGFAAR